MTAARLTAAQARRLGIDPGPTRTGSTTRKVARGAPYHTRCVTCREEFTTEAAEERHLVSHRHARYVLIDPVIPLEAPRRRVRVHGCPHCRCVQPTSRRTGHDPNAPGAGLVVEVDAALYGPRKRSDVRR